MLSLVVIGSGHCGLFITYYLLHIIYLILLSVAEEPMTPANDVVEADHGQFRSTREPANPV